MSASNHDKNFELIPSPKKPKAKGYCKGSSENLQ
jgi:hypothetical protein